MTDAPRKPLLDNPELRRKLQREFGLDENNWPLNATPEERAAHALIDATAPVIPLNKADRRAALTAGLEKKPMEPLVSPTVAKIAGAIALVLGLLAAALPSLPFAAPAWLGIALWALTYVASLLGGLGLPVFKGGSPLVPLAMVPTLLSIGGGLTVWASTLPPGTFQSVVLFVGALCLALAGKAIPLSGQAANDNSEAAKSKAA